MQNSLTDCAAIAGHFTVTVIGVDITGAHCAAVRLSPQPRTDALVGVGLKHSRQRHGAARPPAAGPRKLRHDASARPAAVAIQATSAIHTMAREIACNGGKSAASDRRRLASAYMPSGNTTLHSIGV